MNDLFWVIVLYNKNPILPYSFKILNDIFNINKEYIHSILIYDNSNYPLNNVDNIFTSENVDITYLHNPLNPGIAKAYNHALQIANKLNKKWLLLLDQDTILNNLFLVNLNSSLELAYKDFKIVSIIPKVLDGNKIVSPTQFVNGVFSTKIKNLKIGILSGHATAINSGSCISTNYLNNIGGFNENFPLDILDHWFYYTCYIRKMNILLNNSVIQHSLSVSSGIMPIDRYKNAIVKERYLFCNIANFNFNYKVLLFFRFLKQIFKLRFRLAIHTMFTFLKHN